MKKILIVRIAASLGNQLFMYANAFSLSKKYNLKLLIDNTSGYFQKKNTTLNRIYALNYFKIKSKIAPKKYKYDNYLKHIFFKYFSFFFKFFFYREFINKFKITKYKKIKFLNKNIYLIGYYQSELYFKPYKNDLVKCFSVKKKFLSRNFYKYYKLLNSCNSISLHIRRGKLYNLNQFYSGDPNLDSDPFFKKMIFYNYSGINYFKKKIKNPVFFIWSNNFDGLDKFFDKSFIFIKNNSLCEDFELFKYSKHFIVSPSTFHWWGAWLNINKNKICLRPKNINPSNNLNFWPKEWIKV